MSAAYGAPERPSFFLSHSEAAKLIGFGRRSLDRAIKLGAIPTYNRFGSPVIDRTAALEFREKLLKLAREVGGNDD